MTNWDDKWNEYIKDKAGVCAICNTCGASSSPFVSVPKRGGYPDSCLETDPLLMSKNQSVNAFGAENTPTLLLQLSCSTNNATCAKNVS